MLRREGQASGVVCPTNKDQSIRIERSDAQRFDQAAERLRMQKETYRAAIYAEGNVYEN